MRSKTLCRDAIALHSLFCAVAWVNLQSSGSAEQNDLKGFIVPIAITAADETPERLTPSEEKQLPKLNDKHQAHARVEADFRKAQLPWLKRTLGVPFAARASGKPWEKEALAFVTDALEHWEPESAYEAPYDAAARAAGLVKSGCDDPFVQWLAARFRYRATYSWRWHHGDYADGTGIYDYETRQGAESMQAAFSGLKRTNLCAGAQRLMLFEMASIWRQTGGNNEYEKRARQANALLPQALTDGSYELPAEEELLVAHLLRRPAANWIPETVGEVAQTVEKLRISDWARDCILGCINLSDGRAFLKSDRPKWLTLRDRAYQRWMDASKLRPDRPEPASTVFRYCGLVDAPQGVSAVTWCERTIAAQFDFSDAYKTLLSQLRSSPESSRLLGAFGRQCVATKRFDTSVPLVLPEALQRSLGKQTPWRSILRKPENAAALVELGRGMTAHPSRQSDAIRWRSLLVVWAWLAGEDAIAADALKALPDGHLHPVAIDQLRDFNVSLDELKTEMVIRLSPAKVNFAQGQQHLVASNLSDARRSFEEALSLAPPDPAARAWIAQHLEIAAFEEAVGKGEWMPVPTALSGWQVLAGNWSNTEDKALVLTGDGRPAHIRFRGRTGINVEFKGEFQGANQEVGIRQLEIGIAFRCRFDHDFEQFSTWTKDAKTFHVGLRDGFYPAEPEVRRRGKPPDTHAPQAEMNTFHLHTDARFTTFTLNNHVVYKDLQNLYTLSKDLRKGQATIGFAARALAPNQKMVIRNLKVRRLPTPLPFNFEKRRELEEQKAEDDKRQASITAQIQT